MSRWICQFTRHSSRAQTPPQYGGRVVFVLGLVWMLLLACGGSTAATGYSCVTSPCHAQVTWSNAAQVYPQFGTNYHGFDVELYAAPITCAFACGVGTGWIKNAATLYDSSTSSWVELGYEGTRIWPGPKSNLIGSIPIEQYFWEVHYPDGTDEFTFLGPVATDRYGKYGVADVCIKNCIGPDMYIVTGAGQYFDSFPLAGLGGAFGDTIVMGQELYGTGGAAAQAAFFLKFQINFNPNGPLVYQSDNGALTVDRPPYGNWVVMPSKSQTGGAFYTECCLPLQ